LQNNQYKNFLHILVARSIRVLTPAFLVIIVQLLFSAAVISQADDDVIAIDSAEVLVNVTVTDRSGSAVNGIAEKEFTILDDGETVKPMAFLAETTPFAAVILIDTSGSMESRLGIARGAAINFLNGIRRSDQVAVLNFDSKIKTIRDFSSGFDLPDNFYDIKADGMTVLNDAVFKASEMLASRPEKRRAIIVLSDGADTSSKHSIEKAAKMANLAGATIYTVDMAPKDTPPAEKIAMQTTLKGFASKTGGTFVQTPGGPEMRTAFLKILSELGNQYTFSFQPKDNRKDGKFHSIEVRIKRPNLTIRTRKGYSIPKK